MAARNTAVRKLRKWQEDIRKTPEAVAQMPGALAPIVKGQIDDAIAAGQSIGGEAWAPRKKDGAKALQGAQKDVKVTPVVGSNPAIRVTLEGGTVYSQYGTSHQQRREILNWDKGVPPKLGNAIRLGIIDMGLPFMQRAGGHGAHAAGVPWKGVAKL